MPAVVLERPTTIRDKLRTATSRLQAAQQRLSELESGQERCQDQLREANQKLSDAEGVLQRRQDVEASRLASEYVSGRPSSNPVASAREHVTTCQAEVDRLERVEAALASQIQHTQSTLRVLRTDHLTALAEFVVTSPEYQSLVAAHSSAWHRLRSVKTALMTVTAAMQGNMPQRYMDEAYRSEPLEERVGFGVDQELVGAWRSALERLASDADAELPP
jgi:chromosome segregation ATPase